MKQKGNWDRARGKGRWNKGHSGTSCTVHDRWNTGASVVPNAVDNTDDLSGILDIKKFAESHAESLREPPPALVASIADIEADISDLESQEGRHKIRLVRDLERKLASEKAEYSMYLDGTKRRRYIAETERYLVEYENARDTNTRGNISDSLVRIADTQVPIRHRKRSDLSHTIRMASRTDDDSGTERHSIRDEFVTIFHGAAPAVYISHGDMCPTCDKQLARDMDNSLVCSDCGINVQVHDSTANAVSWNDELDYASFQYKRSNHFSEWLNASTAKQTCDIPDEVLRQCMSSLAREKVRPDNVDAMRIRQILKNLDLQKFYEHSLLISCRLTGKTPPRITPEQEEQLRVMFAQIQEPFEKCREVLFPNRKNFLSYSYCLYKFAELLGLDHFKKNFQLLKGREVLYKQDVIFRAICEELGWSFTPSI